MPIGVFDSGLGGLTILDAIVRAPAGQDFVYLGDNANAPYGWSLRPSLRADHRRGRAAVRRGLRPRRPRLQHRLGGGPARPAGQLAEPGDPPGARGLRAGDRASDPPRLGRQRAADPHRPPRRRALRDAGDGPQRRLPARAPVPGARRHRRAAGLHRPRRGDRGGRPRSRRRVAAEHVAALLARLPAPQSAVLGCTHYPLVEAAFREALPAGDDARLPAGADRREPCRLPEAPPAFAGGSGAVAP